MAQSLDGASIRTVANGNIVLAKDLCRRFLDSDQQLDATVIGTPGCSAQDCIKIVSNIATCIVKVPRKHTRAAREAANIEARWTRWASDLGVTPKVLAVDEQSGAFAMDFISGHALGDQQAAVNVVELVQILRGIHYQKPQLWMRPCQDPAIGVAEVIQIVQNKGYLNNSHVRFLTSVISMAKTALSCLDSEITPCHNDFHGENVLLDQQHKMWCIDFECAGLGDPMWDLAYLATYVDSISLPQLAEMYSAADKQRERLNFFYCLALIQNIAWFAMNGSAGIQLRDARLRQLEEHLMALEHSLVDPGCSRNVDWTKWRCDSLRGQDGCGMAS